ncbi:MAG TPA: leucyl/phenylalanyl-tRNA--protein transferase [Sphingomonas sp.]|jgi:leucyl/phenylalanyl-tRNA--protein transferase|nr:leucyl/phenylalanyl-tRNA--protein transferase [Sphingomonas sp.]
MARHRAAAGGIGAIATLDPGLVLGAYSVGVFPMADGRDASDVYWVEPKDRAILPLDGFRCSRSLRKVIAADRFRVTADAAFGDVLALCAQSVAGRPETWINRQIERVFGDLHARGFAHSIECWDGDQLVGGLYGLALGRAFFGESMVSRSTNASKVALAWLVARLRIGGYTLLDCQFQTAHLATLGAIEIGRSDYMVLLGEALSGLVAPPSSLAAGALDADFRALDRGWTSPSGTVSAPPTGKDIAQLFVQTS